MTHTYHIEGMTCNNCRASVEEKIAALDGVETVTVDLGKKEAIVKMNKPLSTKQLQQILPDKYAVSEKTTASITESSIAVVEARSSKWQQLKPLFLILFYISVATFLMNRHALDYQAMMLDFMGLFFIVFSFFKMLDLKGFPESFKMYDPLAKRLPFYGKIYPFIETALGLLFLLRYEVKIALFITLIILGITTVGVTKSLLDKRAIRCACLGTALNLPMTEATFIENAIMLIMGIVMLVGM